MYHRVITLTLDIANELGHRLFDQNSPLFGVIAIQNVGYGWVARHPTLHALNIFWVFDPYATSTASHIRQYNMIFDLDDTLIFNPPLPHPESTPALYYVNQTPPHTICDDPIDTPVKRPHIQEFLSLICDHFKLIKVCTLSLRERARQIIELLDPQHRTLLKDLHGTQVLVAREDMAEGYSQSARLKIMRGVPPKGFKKNFAVLKMNSLDSRSTTIVLDDSPGFWSVSAKDNIVPIYTAARTDTLKNSGYLNGFPGDGGVIGRQILMTLMNLAVKAEGAPHLMQPLELIVLDRRKPKGPPAKPAFVAPAPKRPAAPPPNMGPKPSAPRMPPTHNAISSRPATPPVDDMLGNGTATSQSANPPPTWSTNGTSSRAPSGPSTVSDAPGGPGPSSRPAPALPRRILGPQVRVKRPERDPTPSAATAAASAGPSGPATPTAPAPPGAVAPVPSASAKAHSRAIANAAAIRATRRVGDKPSALATTYRVAQQSKKPARPVGKP